MSASPPAPPAVESGATLEGIGELLRITDVQTLIARPTTDTPHSPLYEYVQSTRRGSDNGACGSPAMSVRSEDSLDSIITLSANASIHEELHGLSEQEVETNNLIYRLCRSLYKKVLQRTNAGSDGTKRSRNRRVSVDDTHEKNMFFLTDWMPLLHLFEPKAFYAYHNTRDTTYLPSIPESPIRNNNNVFARNPHEASRQLLEELNVEKLSGGNSNHVYRLASATFPDKVILLRVYGSGDDEAIDRLRDVEAMKQMSKAALSPAVLHSFKWGRVEEFMDNVATCTTDMLIASPSLLSEVYTVLAQMHALSYDPFLPQSMNKNRFKAGSAIQHFLSAEEDKDPEEYCRTNAARLRDALTSTKNSDYYREALDAKVMEEVCPTAFERASLRFLRLTSALLKPQYRSGFVRFIGSEIMALRGLLQRHHVPMVFSHNDLNPGNILLSWRKVPPQFRTEAGRLDCAEDEGDEVTPVVSEQSSFLARKFLTKKGRHRNLVDLKGVVFIDFEYSDVNYRCFDLGNTLCELDYDYSRGTEDGGPGFIKYLYAFPPQDYKDAWTALPMTYPRLPHLMFDAWTADSKTGGFSAEALSSSSPSSVGDSCLHAVRNYFRASAKDDGRCLKLTGSQLSEVFLGMLASHMHWALWSFVLACNPDQCTNNTNDDGGFARGSSGLDYIFYGNCRLKEYLALKDWMQKRDLL